MECTTGLTVPPQEMTRAFVMDPLSIRNSYSFVDRSGERFHGTGEKKVKNGLKTVWKNGNWNRIELQARGEVQDLPRQR
jgi:hypothetical protein